MLGIQQAIKEIIRSIRIIAGHYYAADMKVKGVKGNLYG